MPQQRLPVLYLHRQDLLVGRQARRLRPGQGGSRRCPDHRACRIPDRQDLEDRHH
jgi:hypothetical protein